MDKKTKKVIWVILILFGIYRIVSGAINLTGPTDPNGHSEIQSHQRAEKQLDAPEESIKSGQKDGDTIIDYEPEGADDQEQSLEIPDYSKSKSSPSLKESGYYYARDDVALYIHLYGHLPDNYITKSEADQMGWSPEDRDYVVGGNRFGNREGKLPKKPGRQYYEADVQAGYTHHRGPQRLVYSDDGLIFYTSDHYETFEQLY